MKPGTREGNLALLRRPNVAEGALSRGLGPVRAGPGGLGGTLIRCRIMSAALGGTLIRCRTMSAGPGWHTNKV